MTRYYITTFETEDQSQMTCEYGYDQWIELIKSFKQQGIKFHAYKSSL